MTHQSPIRRALGTIALAGVLSGATGCAVETEPPESDVAEAEAAVTPGAGAIIDFVVKFYDNVFKVAAFIKKKPADPATVAAREILARIDAAEDNILAALADARWQNQQYVAANLEGRIQTVLDNFRTLTQMSATDVDLLPLRLETQILALNVLNEFNSIVERKVDAQLSYELAPAFNALLATYVSVLAMKREITPADPVPLTTFQTALSRGLQTNYKLIGARSQACSGSQYIPRRDRMYVGKDSNLVSGDLVGPIQNFALRESQLFKEKFADRWVTWQRDFTCNLKQNKCTAAAFYAGSNNGLPQQCNGWNVPAGLAQVFQSCLTSARNSAVTSAFNADSTVGIIRESMRSMFKLGATTLATTGGAFPGLNPAVGSYFDPVITAPFPSFDGACETGRRVYVISP